MKYEKELEMDFDIALSEEHIRKKGKRYIIGNDDITTITAEDIELPKASTNSKAKQIGFCA